MVEGVFWMPGLRACPAGGTYTIGRVVDTPTCSHMAHRQGPAVSVRKSSTRPSALDPLDPVPKLTVFELITSASDIYNWNTLLELAWNCRESGVGGG